MILIAGNGVRQACSEEAQDSDEGGDSAPAPAAHRAGIQRNRRGFAAD